LSELGVSLSELKPDVFHAFYFNRQLINYYYLTYNTSIPFTMQECTNPTRLITNNWGAGKISHVAARWEREIIASGAVRIRLVMPSYRTSFPSYIQKSVRAFSNPCYVNQISNIADMSIKLDVIINGFKGNKNLITLLMAFNELKDHFPSWSIKVVGNNEGEQPHKVAIREYINKNELVGKVKLVGATEDMEVEYLTSKIHVIASLSEGCPTCVLEAMSCGIPSIGFEDCSGTNELILHNGNGILANSVDRVVGLRDSLYALMSNESLVQKLGQQALSDSAVFHPENVYDQWEELFYEASAYKNNLNMLYAEQLSIAPELTRHARRMRDYYGLESNRVL
jgi:glycosyltransferase involved in cell wall biosynthesis